MHARLLSLMLGSFPLLAFQGRPQDPSPPPTLHGVVVNQAGEPLEGASVFVYTAAPRRGSSAL